MVDPIGPAYERYDLLGYDVADYNLLGGLANCGYTPEEAASLAPAWAPLLCCSAACFVRGMRPALS